jgi:hypothetical protein
MGKTVRKVEQARDEPKSLQPSEELKEKFDPSIVKYGDDIKVSLDRLTSEIEQLSSHFTIRNRLLDWVTWVLLMAGGVIGVGLSHLVQA